ncbi:MAG: DUF5717 family protein [Defluviitaleaceae bacterium]|nr:DUF5717 family protein [Defluviitaleaceae bacterium]
MINKEHPLPIPELDITSLSINANTSGSGFTIKNTGGDTLSGYILPRQNGLTFTPSHWEGNTQAITYTINQEEIAAQNHTIETNAYICTNGGEINLPITINPSPMTIPTDEGHNITTTQDFYNYAQTHPAAARKLFTSSEFYMLLLSTGYKYLDIYEILHKDANRERAMDNFFILSGHKAKTHLTLDSNKLSICPTSKTPVKFYVQKTDNGYADAPITLHSNAPWLTLSTTRLATTDYDENNQAEIGIMIDPGLIPGPFAREHIQVGPEPTGDNILELNVKQPAPFALHISRVGYRYEDRGSIEVENNTGGDMRIEVYSRDRYIRFNANSYVIGESHSVPFEIRPTAFASAQRLFRRLPYISTYVDVRAHCPGQVFHKRLFLTIGEW